MLSIGHWMLLRVGLHMCLTLYDLTKAFDSVPYELSLNKIEFYGISKTKLKTIQLTNKKQYVFVGGKVSYLEEIKISHPPGRGQILFRL